MKMSNDNKNNKQNNYQTKDTNYTNDCTVSNASCNDTPYETCCEMDDINAPEYSTEIGITSYNNYHSPNTIADDDNNNDDDENPNNSENEEESRLRGGCGGNNRNSGGCGCGGFKITPGVCPPRDDCQESTTIPCGTPSCDSPCGGRTGSCCLPAGCKPPICRKPIRSRCSTPCTSEPQGCGGGGCCGSGCRGGCGKPGRLCMPLRPCSTPPCQPQICRPRGSPCMQQRCCTQVPPCCKSMGNTFRPGCNIGGGGSCCRTKSPRRGCCSIPQDDVVCGYCGPKLPPPAGCECLGGGLDCQRCGRKVYQAEMQIASGVPYHNICFSCYCCRKPLEPLTYQENCGEIYCKHCYVRNFGPQGYGYGAGAGVLQTPM